MKNAYKRQMAQKCIMHVFNRFRFVIELINFNSRHFREINYSKFIYSCVELRQNEYVHVLIQIEWNCHFKLIPSWLMARKISIIHKFKLLSIPVISSRIYICLYKLKVDACGKIWGTCLAAFYFQLLLPLSSLRNLSPLHAGSYRVFALFGIEKRGPL
jgi:hypothetical protein